MRSRSGDRPPSKPNSSSSARSSSDWNDEIDEIEMVKMSRSRSRRNEGLMRFIVGEFADKVVQWVYLLYD